MRPRIGIWLAAGLLTLLAAPAGSALAEGHGTPDHVTPSVEAVCAKTRGGPAYGLCVAYCEANDCDLDPNTQECVELRKRYSALTGSSIFPCDDDLK
jgi:hypothetical protein